MVTDEDRRKAASRLRECRGGWSSGECYYAIIAALGLPDTSREDGGNALYARLADLIEPSDRRRADEWRDFATDPPTDKKPVLCKSANGKIYVGTPCFFAKGTFTGEVWVPRGDQCRKPAKWMEIDDDYR